MIHYTSVRLPSYSPIRNSTVILLFEDEGVQVSIRFLKRKLVSMLLSVFLLGLTPYATSAAGPNLIANPGVEASSTTGLPSGWLKGGYGTNTRVLSYPVTGYESPRALKTSITSYTSGDAKWYFSAVPVKANTTYEFSNVYRSNTRSYVTVQFKLADGTLTYRDIGTLGSSTTWKTFTTSFTTPANATALTVFHLIKSVGYLETDNYFLGTASADPTKFDQGYVSIHFDDGVKQTYQTAYPILNEAGFKSTSFIITARLKENDFPGYVKANDVLAMQTAGHEIGAHTRTHANLTTLSATSAKQEILGSRNDLLAIGAKPVNYFAYPYGSYNSAVKQLVKDAGFLGARSSDGGYNLKTQDPFILRRQPMVNSTTFATVKQSIDKARADHTWVILLFHQVDQSGDTYAVTPELFQQIVDYLKEIGETPITLKQGLELMKQ